ncbi:MAG: DUF1329 domain-containing protein, partial [Myxococcales bacterium]|nr:DUF1329 domain-containing protein [Myxococcales bacterium]
MALRAPAHPRGAAAYTALLLALLAATARAGAPPEGVCPSAADARAGASARGAQSGGVREGMRLGYRDVLELRALLPVELWRNRSVFFHEGMTLEVGACHRRYPVPRFFARATQHFAGRARLDAEGNLHDHVAGLPFPPDAIDASAPDAGLRWAWNLERRYRGAGPSGRFRIVDLPSRMGGIQTYLGTWFLLQTGLRADLEASGGAVAGAERSLWIAGGRFDAPSAARHLAWRQLRAPESSTNAAAPDDTFVYVPGLRKVRRASSAWADGMYVPQYRIGGEAGGGALDPTRDANAVTENLRRGFEGLALRPNAYR